MSASDLRTIGITVAILAIGMTAGVVIKHDPERSDLAVRVSRIEEGLERLSGADARLTALEESTTPERMMSAINDIIKAKAEARRTDIPANEAAAIALLRHLMAAQVQFQRSGWVDTDSDGTGEYGGFVEMAGAAAGRMVRRIAPNVLMPGRLGTLTANGEAARNGYFFRIYLPDNAGAGFGEPQLGYRDDNSLDGDLDETTWCAYAWPVEQGRTGKRTFFVHQDADVVATNDGTYSGTSNGPAPDAAFRAIGTITGSVAIGEAGQDGNIWAPAPK